jgi:hypothetical protein
VIDRRPVTQSFVELLEEGTDMPIGLGEVPARLPKKPWGIVHVIDGGGFDGPALTDPDADAAFVYQVDSVGFTVDQVQWMDDLVRRTVLARHHGAFQVPFPEVEGVQVQDRRPDTAAGTAVPEGEPPNRVYTISGRYSIHVTPA